MRSSRGITLTLLSATMLTACCCAWPGMRSRNRDMTWYDVNHHPIPEQWRTNADGSRDPAVTVYDVHGKPWVKDSDGTWHPQDLPGSSHSSHRRVGFLPLFFGSGYRSSGSYGSSSYHSSRSSTSHGFGSTASHSSGS